jgi:hypothetical protein
MRTQKGLQRRNPQTIALWHDAVRMRRALLQAMREGQTPLSPSMR